MKNSTKKYFLNRVFIAQLISVVLIWFLFTGIVLWVGNLVHLSIFWHDQPGISISITLVALPIFFTLASVLTYVFIGLHKEEKNLMTRQEGEEE